MQLGATCPSDTPVREYNVVAINVVITLNRFLDHDPHGRMFVLEEESARVRREEAQNRTARGSSAESAVSLGLQGDAIQPLTIRVNQGECLRVNLTNNLVDRESASLHNCNNSEGVLDVFSRTPSLLLQLWLVQALKLTITESQRKPTIWAMKVEPSWGMELSRGASAFQ